MNREHALAIIKHCFEIGQISLIPLVIVSIIKLPTVERKSMILLLVFIFWEIFGVTGHSFHSVYTDWLNIKTESLMQSTLLFSQLFLWGAYPKIKWLYIGLGGIFLVWLVVILQFSPTTIGIFTIGYSLLHMILGIDVINRVIKYSIPIKKDYKFICSICIAMNASFDILLNSCGIFIKVIGVPFFINVSIFCLAIDMLIIFTFLYAIIWIPKEQKYSRW